MSLPDNNGPQAVPSTVDQNQLPTMPAQVQSDSQNPPQNPQTVQQPPVTQTETQEPDPLDNHPAVQQASLGRRISEVLAGGPRIRTTYNQDGSVTREKIPLSGKELLTGVLANVLSGIGQTSSNLSARMQGRAPQPIQPLPSQVAAQKQAEQSDEDFNRVQEQKLRKAKIIEANLTAMKAAFAVGKEDDDAKDAYIANHSADLQQYQKDGIIESSNIPSDQLLKKGFDKTKFTVVPDGRVPAFKQDGSGERATNSDGVPLSQLTYSVIDGTTQTPLTPENYEQYVKWGLMRPQKALSDQQSGFKLPEGATISTAAQAIMKHKIDLLGQTQREIDEVAGDGKVNLAARLRENPSLLKDIETFHNDAASQDPLTQLQNVRAKHPGSASAMIDLMGGQSVLNAYAAKTQTADDLSADKAQSIVSDPRTDKTSPAYQKAVAFLKNSRTQKAQTAADEAKAKQQADTGSNGVQETARDIVNGNLAELSDVVSRKGEDRRAMEHALIAEATRQGKDPSKFSPNALKAKEAIFKDYAEGKTSNNIASFDAFLGHAGDAMDANDAWRRSGSPLINKPLSWLAKNATNDTNYVAFDTALEPVRKEFMSFLNANRAEHSEDLRTMQTVLNPNNSPAQVETALKQLGKSADIRLAAIGSKYQNLMDKPFPNLVSDDGKQTLFRMGIKSKALGQSNAQNVQASPQPAPQNGLTGKAAKYGIAPLAQGQQ